MYSCNMKLINQSEEGYKKPRMDEIVMQSDHIRLS